MVDLATAILKQLARLSVGSCSCGVKSPAAAWHDAGCTYRLLEEIGENVEALEDERAEQWRLRRDADGSRDAAKAACDTLRDELAALRQHKAVPDGWRCFHCNEVFHDEHSARQHFGATEDREPACQIKLGAERSMLAALRRAEADAADAWFKLQNESGEAAQAYYAQASRHQEQLRAAEELGYERGLRDASPLPSSSGTGWRPMREAKHDGSIVVGRYWQMADAPNGPYPGYVLMQWDLLEDGGWMDPEGLDYIHEDVVDFLVIETRGEPLPAAPVSHGGGRGE